jgi:6-phosphogluconolactonase (cycloisomerase 2 family)
VYVATLSDNTITEFVIGADGTLTADTLAQIVELPGSLPWGISVNPSTPQLYVVDYGNSSMQPYIIGPSGHLQGGIAPAPTGRTPWWSAVSPNGANLYVANNDDATISQYLIAVNGSLTQLNPTTVATGRAPRGVTLDPSGHHAYVANFDDNTISMYNVGANGALSAMSPATVSTGGTQPAFVRFDPTGHHLYVTNFANGDVGSVAHFTVDANGVLTAATPFTFATGKGPSMIQLDRTGRFAYVPNARDDTISQYSVGGDGALAPLGTPTLATGHTPIDLEITY